MKAGWDLWLEQHGSKFGGRDGRDRRRRRGRGPGHRRARRPEGAPAGSVDIVVGHRQLGHRARRRSTRQRGQEAPDRRQRRRRRRHRRRASTSGARRSPTARSPTPSASTSRDAGGQEGRVRDGAPTTPPARRRSRASRRASRRAAASRRRGEDAVRHDAGLPAVPGEGAQLRRRARSSCFYAGAEAVSFVKQYEEFGLSDAPALRLRLPHRGRRADRAGRRRGRRADHAALRDGARQPGQQGFARGLPGQGRQAADRLRGAGLGRRGGARPGASRRRARSTATRWPARWAGSARSTTARAARGASSSQSPGRRCTCARCARRATP